MNASKALLAALIALAAGYAILSAATLRVGENTELCKATIVRAIAPWSSGCFYTALINDAPSETQIQFEHAMLSRFAENKGVAPEVLLYRAKFYRKYQLAFRKDFAQLHYMHLDYTRSEHTNLLEQMEYFKFLQANQLLPLAQTTLDEFCSTYVPAHRDDFVDSIGESLIKFTIPLSVMSCEMKLNRYKNAAHK